MQAGTMHRSDFNASRLLQKMINNRLFVQEAEQIGLADDSAVVAAVQRQRESLAYKALLRESTPDTFTVSDDELRAEYNRLYQKLDLRSICVADSAPAFQIADSIRRGVPMDQLAKRHSVDRFKDIGGLAVGQVLRSMPSDMHGALADGQVGDLIGPLAVWRIWATFRLEARHPADSSMFDSLKAEMRQIVFTRKRNEFRRQYVQQVRKDISVVIDSAQVDSILIRMGMGLEEGETSVATVAGNRVLTALSLRNKYIHEISGRVDRDPRLVLHEVLNEQVAILILKEAAKRQEVLSRSELDAPLKAYRDSLLVAYYLEDVVAPTVKISDEDVAAYYEKNQSLYRAPDRYKIASITRDSLAEANADYAAAISGTDFAWLARRNSTDDFKEKGGERNWLDASAFPAPIRAELDSLPLGGIAQPTSVDDGYIVMKLLDRTKGERLSLQEVSARIRGVLAQPKQLQAIDAAVTALRKAADIHVDEDVLKNLQIAGPVEKSDTKASK